MKEVGMASGGAPKKYRAQVAERKKKIEHLENRPTLPSNIKWSVPK